MQNCILTFPYLTHVCIRGVCRASYLIVLLQPKCDKKDWAA